MHLRAGRALAGTSPLTVRAMPRAGGRRWIEGLEQRLFLSDSASASFAWLLSRSRPASGDVATAMPLSAGTGSIAGAIFNDFNGNGSLDGGENGISGVTVFLDLNQNNVFDAGDASVTSNGSGSYLFEGLTDGTYFIGIVTPAGYVRTGSLVQSAVVTGGGAVDGKNLGNFRTTYVGSNGSDNWVIRMDAADNTRLQVLQTLLGQSTVTWSIAKSAIPSLTINAGAGDDVIHVDHTNGNPTPAGGIVIDGESQSTPMADRVSVTGSAGPDTLSVHHANFAAANAPLAVRNVERVTLNGGNGNDSITIGQSIGAEVTVDGGSGTDLLNWNGTDGADLITLNGSSVADSNFTAGYAAIEALVVNAGAGNDDVQLLGTASGTPVTIQGGTGNDVLTIAAAPSSPVSFQGGLSAGDQDVLNVNAGAYTFATNANLSSANLTVNVGSAGSVTFNATQNLAGLHVAGNATLTSGGAKVLVTRGLSSSGSGRLNLTDNGLILHYSGPTSPLGTWNGTTYTGVSGMLRSGHNGGAWNGSGLMTTSATAITGLVSGEAFDVLKLSGSQTALWSGQTVDATTVLVKYSYRCDATLDGRLNIDDYGQIDFHVGLGQVGIGHYNGDFNLDGLINIDDYGEIDFTVGIQGPPL